MAPFWCWLFGHSYFQTYTLGYNQTQWPKVVCRRCGRRLYP